MKQLGITALLLAIGLCFSGCNNSDSGGSGSSGAGPDKNSLPSPGPTRDGVVANGNANVGSNSSAASQNDALRNNFWMTAAQGGMAEVELSRVAQGKATNAEVKKFAEMMVADHTRANSELRSLAQKTNVTLPTAMSSANQTALTEMQGLSGADFDRKYVAAMVANHEADVQLFESQAQDDSEPDAKAFAAKTLPTLQKHLSMIRGIEAKIK